MTDRSTGAQQSATHQPTGADYLAEQARRANELAQSDAAAQREREQQQRQDEADIDAERARIAAENAASAAEALAKKAEQARAEADDDGLDEVDFGQSRISVRTLGGGVRHYGPGKVRVPRSVADTLKNAPTFATSGDPLNDALVRRRLERDHGVVEVTTAAESSERSAFGSEAHNEGGDEGEGQSRGATRRTRNKDKEPLSKSAIAALGAEEVSRRYDKAVKAGKVKPIADGKGSGADGAVVTADRVDALADAGETE